MNIHPYRIGSAALCLLLAIAPALRGQDSGRDRLNRWAVLDFQARGPLASPEVSRDATDSVVLELSQLSRYDVFSRDESAQALKSLGLAAPLSVISERRLGRQLGAGAVVTGEAEAVILPAKPRRVQVTLSIRVRDTHTGELINGARVAGLSEPGHAPGADVPALEEEAATNAAFMAVAQMSQFALPRASVLMLEDPRTVLLSHGSQEGLTAGLRMVVTRFGERIGVVRVTRVEADQAEAAVIERGAGIAPEDVATAIYTLPADPVRP